MTPSSAVVACSTLVSELEQVAPEVPLRTIPQELHEFPANPPDDAAIEQAVTEAIDGFDDEGYDHIAVAYSRTNRGLAAVRAGTTPLFVSPFDDCIDLLRRDRTPKADGTYYLTRGWVDHGVDLYKLYRAYAGTLDELVASFHQAESIAGFDWHAGDRFTRLTAETPRPTEDALDRFFEELVGPFTDVVLVDTGTLTPFHQTYAEEFAAFLETYATADSVSVTVEPGTHRWLGDLVTGDESIPRIRPGDLIGDR